MKEEFITAVAARSDVKVTINADKRAPFGEIIRVMDAAKEAGVKGVTALTKEVTKP